MSLFDGFRKKKAESIEVKQNEPVKESTALPKEKKKKRLPNPKGIILRTQLSLLYTGNYMQRTRLFIGCQAITTWSNTKRDINFLSRDSIVELSKHTKSALN